ncbi:hypothetical protein FIBSPDRAFT_805582 [Athelia psychrophila]|uniref:CHAT domain-containing protein n=1 Tax=Athelia psychrophila TaxID=1759441 RepID=A0A167W4Z2_9AGAM|nr:hypothetical protein FIBSPDRAFT_805582 [Fibularhizoctonia sp. CBS 109695]
MSSTGIIVGGIKGLSFLHSGVDSESHRSNSPPGQISELEVFAKAVQTLEQARQVIAGFLDVVGACITNDQEEGELVGILKALVALDGRLNAALVLLHERVASTQSNPRQTPATDQLYGNLVTIGSLLENLSGSTKHILTAAGSSIETSHPDIVDSIRSAVQDFAAVNKLRIEEIVAACALPGELENDGAPGQLPSPPIPAQSRDTSPSAPDESLALHSPNSEEPEPVDEVKIENQLGMDVHHLYPGDHDRPSSLHNLANSLATRFEQLGQIADLEQAIIYQRAALELHPPGHPDRSGSLNNLATSLAMRFEQLGQMADLEQGIIYQRAALELCPPGHPDRSGSLFDLAISLKTRFEQLGQMADLEQAIIYQRAALELCPPGHPDHSGSLNNLASSLFTRFQELGQMADLEQAIIYQRAALELRPPGHRNRSYPLNNLAGSLLARFEQLGQMTDLEQAIIYRRAALELCPPGHLTRSSSLSGLAKLLKTRFQQLGQMADLEQAIIYQRAALELRPPGHPNRSSSLNNLANSLLTRFQQLGQMADLEQAIIYQRAALELHPLGHPDRAMSLNNLGNSLWTRFEELGQMADLEQGIIYQRAALELRSPGHPNHSGSLNNLANSLSTRFEQLGQMADLEQAIIYQRAALELRPPGHHHRPSSLHNLANSLVTRFEQFGQMADLEEAVELLQSGANDTTDTPAHRYRCASRLVVTLKKHDQALLLETYQLALNLLQLVLAVYPDVELRRTALGADRLSPILAMSAAAHAIGKGQPEKAVEMLEQGRGMLYSNIRGYRQPVEAVRQYDSPLADRFKATSDELEALATSSQLRSDKLSSEGSHESGATSEARWKRQRELNLEREDIIQQIRRLPGFDHFLKAVPFSELRNAAAEGPVIIVNVAELRSDVIILHQRNPPIVLPMQPQNGESVYLTFLDLSKQLFEGRGQDGFSELLKKTILKKLDELLVTPVLEKLESLCLPKKPKTRIWWCPTSALCALPIHAAGKLPIKYISSYTPTLSALISARKIDDRQPPAILNASKSNLSLLAIVYPGQPPQTEGEHDGRLHTVDEEYEVIKTAAQASQGRDVVRPDPTREAALAQLPYHRWAHFACHGRLDTSEPFKSSFELQGDSLSLSDLIHARLPNADFAFLAACDSATSGGITDTPDESLHLAAAVQFCGIHSVVGTLWPMADVDGPRVAQVFYKHMFKGNDSRKSAEALDKVVTTMRLKRGPWENTMSEGEALQRWANYIHIGA